MTRKGRCGRDRFLNCCKRHKNSQQKPILDRMQGCCPVLQTFPRKILTFPPHADLAKVLNSFSFFKWTVPMMIIDRQKKVKRFGVHSLRELQSKTNFAFTIYRDVKVQWKWLEIEKWNSSIIFEKSQDFWQVFFSKNKPKIWFQETLSWFLEKCKKIQ